MENAKKYFEEAIKTEEAKELFSSYEKPETDEDAIKIHIEIAAKLGIELSEEEIKEYFAKKTSVGEVDDEELAQLSGGGDFPECKDTYQDGENCWWEDGCDLVFNDYYYYLCKGRNLGSPEKCGELMRQFKVINF